MDFLKEPSTPRIEEYVENTEKLINEIISYTKNKPSLYEINEGLEEIKEYLKIQLMSGNEKELYVKLNEYSYGLLDADDVVANIKKASLAIIKFIIGVLDRVIKFIMSFFNKGMTLTEKLFLANIIRKRDNLERTINEKNLNKNEPLDINENTIRRILKRKDLLILEAANSNNEINPTMVINYARSTLTLFTDNLTMYDNTCDSIINMTRDLKTSTVTNQSFIGYASEKNKYMITALSPIKNAYKRNSLLSKVIEIGSKKYRKDNFELFIIPLPKKGRAENKMGYVAVGVLKQDVLSKMKYEDIKSMEDLLFSKLDYVEYKELGINVDKLEEIKVKSASYSEIDTIVEIYREASEKIKKKYKPEKLTKKLEKIKKQMTVVNKDEFDSKVNNFKLHYINVGISIATLLIQSSTELYGSGYCDSIKDYIDAHTV